MKFQIGDSVRDQTQNLWFHKRVKHELELGILEHIGSLTSRLLGYTND